MLPNSFLAFIGQYSCENNDINGKDGEIVRLNQQKMLFLMLQMVLHKKIANHHKNSFQ
jgi:hypothetical protein